MDPEEFRRAAHRHADWVAEYFEHIRDRPVLPRTAPGDLIRSLPAQAPEQGESFDQILADFDETVMPAMTLWNHPRFFGYFAISATPPSVLADFLSAALNANAMLWRASPGATELEQVTLNWLRQWLQLPEQFFGILYDTASVGVLQAIGAAREYVAPEFRKQGMARGLTVYLSEQTHSSSEKAAITLGFGTDHVRKIGVDGDFRMRPDLLEKAIRSDIEAGLRPCCIVASVGSTSTSAVDPVPAIADVAERYGIWLHVDAAYGGSAAVVPEMRHILAGVERAQSFVVNPHKWLYVGFDCSVLYTSRPDILRRASSLTAEYLRTPQDEQVINFMDYGVQLGRRFRALKLWYVFRFYGREGVIKFLRQSLQHAQLLRAWIEADPEFELAAPVPLALVCFRHRSDNATNERLLHAINESGKALLSHTVLQGRFVLRMSIGNFMTTEEDVRETWRLIRACVQEVTRAYA